MEITLLVISTAITATPITKGKKRDKVGHAILQEDQPMRATAMLSAISTRKIQFLLGVENERVREL